MSNKKSETLGMPHGTANNRLRKSIMFKYVVLAGDNYCYKCGAEIESVDELSIEHIIPWEGVSLDLFFDLDNITFSHLKCNRPNRPNHNHDSITKRGPEGTSWCTSCKQFLPIDNFCKLTRRYNGLHFNCKRCKNEQNKMYYRKNKKG